MVVLPPLRPQRRRRADLHPAADVRQDQEPHLGGAALRRERWCARTLMTARGARRGLGGEEGADAARGRRQRVRRPRVPQGPDAAGLGRRRRHDRDDCAPCCSVARQPCPRASKSTRSCCRILRKRADLLEGKATWTGRPPRRWPSARSCWKASRCASPARTAGAAPSASATPCSSTSAPAASTCRCNAWRRQACASRCYNSLLSEAAVMGFDFGYAVANHNVLVHVGSAVRRLRQRRAGDHRPVPGRVRNQVGPAGGPRSCCCRTATKARGRSTPARASSAS